MEAEIVEEMLRKGQRKKSKQNSSNNKYTNC